MTTPGMTFTQEGVLTKLTEKTAVLAERAFAPLFFLSLEYSLLTIHGWL